MIVKNLEPNVYFGIIVLKFLTVEDLSSYPGYVVFDSIFDMFDFLNLHNIEYSYFFIKDSNLSDSVFQRLMESKNVIFFNFKKRIVWECN